MSQNDWVYDKDFSDPFIPEIKKILGLYLIGEAPVKEDQKRNTDLIVLELNSVRIGCRIRRAKYYSLYDYRNEFTIRTSRPSGTETELAKIITGWGRYFFYGFADSESANLKAWLLADLNVFRLYFNQHTARNGGRLLGNETANKDRSSTFRSFKIDSFPDNFIIARVE